MNNKRIAWYNFIAIFVATIAMSNNATFAAPQKWSANLSIKHPWALINFVNNTGTQVYPGGLVVRNCDSNNAARLHIKLDVGNQSNTWSGTIVLTCGSSSLALYDAPIDGNIISSPAVFTTNQLPADLYIAGADASTSVRDAELIAQAIDANGAKRGKARAYFTVLWVDTPEVNLNGYTAWLPPTVPHDDPFCGGGPKLIDNGFGEGCGGPSWAWRLVIKAKVYPNEFQPPQFSIGWHGLYLDRLCAMSYFENGTIPSLEPPSLPSNGWGADKSNVLLRRDLPALGDPYLYDYDAPGFRNLGDSGNPKDQQGDPLPDPLKVGDYRRVRQNFLTYANCDIPDAYGRTPTRCSRITAYYVNQSIEKWTSIWDCMRDTTTGWWAEWFEWQPRNDVSGDNNAAVGHGNGLNWDLTNLTNIAGGQP